MTDLIPEADLAWSYIDPHEHDGQRVGVRFVDIRCEHVPTGLVVFVPGQRSAHYARRVARQMIETALTSPDYRP